MDAVPSVEKKKSKYGKYDEYEIEDDARTLARAEEIKADPDKLKYVKMCMKEKKDAANRAYKSIDDLRERAKEVASDEGSS